MSTAERRDLISVEDYLAGELVSPVKHEYIAGAVYAMAGGRNVHNTIVTNITIALGGRLRGKPCQPFNSDTKVRIRLPTHWKFYYPDFSVVCHPNPPDDTFQDEPVVIFEVLSSTTRRIDEGEKKEAYEMIPSLSVYALVEQGFPTIVVYRRSEHGFDREVLHGLDAVLALPEIDAELPLAEVYERVRFAPENDSEAGGSLTAP